MPHVYFKQPQTLPGGNGSCPKYELDTAEDKNGLLDLTTRYWVSVVLMLPLTAIVLRDILPIFKQTAVAMRALSLAEFILATPVVIWSGRPLFVRTWRALKDRKPDAFTVIGLCAGATYLYSLAALFLQTMFSGTPYFGASAMMVTLALYGLLHRFAAECRQGS
jgi:Cu+-exporting ATPase